MVKQISMVVLGEVLIKDKDSIQIIHCHQTTYAIDVECLVIMLKIVLKITIKIMMMAQEKVFL